MWFGVFLVGAYRRLVEAWQWRNEWKTPSAEILLQLLRDNIFGVDKDPQAVELAIFSLCITLAGHLKANRIWEELHFPKLQGSHLLAQDFFQVIQENRFKEPFDLIIGNPPFGSEVPASPKKSSKGVRLLAPISRLCRIDNSATSFLENRQNC